MAAKAKKRKPVRRKTAAGKTATKKRGLWRKLFRLSMLLVGLAIGLAIPWTIWLDLQVRDEFEGRPHSYWTTYRDQVRSITEQDVQRVARKHLHPDRLVYLIVGDWGEIEAGDPDGRASMQQIFGGESTKLPLRDPLTLEPIPD